MTKKQRSEILDLAYQTLPFLIITATFIGLAYTYGHALAPIAPENSFEVIRVTHAHHLSQ